LFWSFLGYLQDRFLYLQGFKRTSGWGHNSFQRSPGGSYYFLLLVAIVWSWFLCVNSAASLCIQRLGEHVRHWWMIPDAQKIWHTIYQNIGYFQTSDAAWALDQSYIQVLILRFLPYCLFWWILVFWHTLHTQINTWPVDSSVCQNVGVIHLNSAT
jgi:hypothetical protein